jgi:hypothetical protein
MKLPGPITYAATLAMLLLLPFMLQNCSSHYENPDYLPSLKIKIPQDAKKDSALVSFILSNEKVINELSNQFEDVAQEIGWYSGKDENDLTLMDKMKLVKLGVNFYTISDQLSEEKRIIDHYVEKKRLENINEADISAYLAVKKALEKRVEELNKKYKNITKIINK